MSTDSKAKRATGTYILMNWIIIGRDTISTSVRKL